MTTIEELQEIVKITAIWLDRLEKIVEENSKEFKEFKKEMKADREKSMREMEKFREEMRESRKESRIEMEEFKEEMRESREKSRKEMKEFKEENKKDMKEFRNVMRWLWYTQWDISEEIIWASFERLLNEKGKKLNKIRTNYKLWKNWDKWEYDIVWINWNEVFVCEIKTKLQDYHVNDFINKWLPNFKKYAKDFKKYKVFWIVWWRIIKKEARKLAIENWMYVIKETHDGKNAKIVNKKDFEIKEYIV